MMNNESYSPYSREDLLAKVKQSMSETRFKHVLGVEQVAIQLAKQYGASVEKASIAALTHDYAKERPAADFIKVIKNEHLDSHLLEYGNEIWHGVIGASFVCAELGITDEEILHAIQVHTVGAAHMSLLDKIIYVADYIEPGRNFPCVDEARKLAKQDLDAAVAYETKHTLAHLIEKEVKIYPATLDTYNHWVAKF